MISVIRLRQNRLLLFIALRFLPFHLHLITHTLITLFHISLFSIRILISRLRVVKAERPNERDGADTENEQNSDGALDRRHRPDIIDKETEHSERGDDD